MTLRSHWGVTYSPEENKSLRSRYSAFYKWNEAHHLMDQIRSIDFFHSGLLKACFLTSSFLIHTPHHTWRRKKEARVARNGTLFKYWGFMHQENLRIFSSSGDTFVHPKYSLLKCFFTGYCGYIQVTLKLAMWKILLNGEINYYNSKKPFLLSGSIVLCKYKVCATMKVQSTVKNRR